jgi:hypothetical protein
MWLTKKQDFIIKQHLGQTIQLIPDIN